MAPNVNKLKGGIMLILTRKVGQKVMIGDDIIVEVVGNEKGEVRLGIIAPKDVQVHREEVYWRLKDENKDKEQ